MIRRHRPLRMTISWLGPSGPHQAIHLSVRCTSQASTGLSTAAAPTATSLTSSLAGRGTALPEPRRGAHKSRAQLVQEILPADHLMIPANTPFAHGHRVLHSTTNVAVALFAMQARAHAMTGRPQ